MNQNKYPTLVEIKNNKKELIEKGEDMLRELNDVRITLEKMRKNEENNLDVITKLEEKEGYLSTELLKLDLGIKILDVIESIIENNIFGDYWKIIEKKIPYDKLLEIVAKNGLNIKKVCLELYKIANIDDQNIVNKIQNLPDEECQNIYENPQLNKYLDKIISRIKKLKKLTNNNII
ncbi:hypothetical protein ACO3TA_05910 [Methanocaldococcus sp. 28A]